MRLPSLLVLLVLTTLGCDTRIYMVFPVDPALSQDDPLVYRNQTIGEIGKVELVPSPNGGAEFMVTVLISRDNLALLDEQMEFRPAPLRRFSQERALQVSDPLSGYRKRLPVSPKDTIVVAARPSIWDLLPNDWSRRLDEWQEYLGPMASETEALILDAIGALNERLEDEDIQDLIQRLSDSADRMTEAAGELLRELSEALKEQY